MLETFSGVHELELELIQPRMAQKPMLRGEVGARALRVRSDVRGHGQVRLCKALGCGRCGCLKPIRACCVVGSAFFLVAPPRGGCAMAPRDSGMCWKQFMMCLEATWFVAEFHSTPMSMSSHELLSGKHGAGAKQGPRGQSAERAGCGLQAVLQQQKAAWVSVRAQARRISTSPFFYVLGFSSFLSPPRSAMRRGAWKCNKGPR